MTNEDVAVTLENHEQQIKSLKHRMDKSEEKDKALTELANSVKILAVNMEYMAKEQEKQTKEQEKQGNRLERLEREPADNFKYYKRAIVACILTSVVSVVVGAILALIIS